MQPAATLLLLPLLAAAASGAAVPAAARPRCDPLKNEATFTTRYDNVDVDAILKSSRLLRAYVDCLMDRGPCTKEGCFIRVAVPDALVNECARCNEYQKQLAGKILAFMLQYHRDGYWREIVEKYDPDGEFRRRQQWVADDEEADYDEEGEAAKKAAEGEAAKTAA